MMNQIRNLAFPAAVLISWVIAAAVCVGSLNDMSGTWAAQRAAQMNRAPAQQSSSAVPNS